MEDRIRVGAGGFGTVFKIKETDGNILAIKIVRGYASIDDFNIEVHSLDREYRTIANLGFHNRIIKIFNVVRDYQNTEAILIMEFLPGGSLADRIVKNGKIEMCSTLKIVTQLCEAVEFLHQNNIFHSDIKPSNIMFTAENNIKLCDFGIAVHLQTLVTNQSSKRAGDNFYMSPERINGEHRSVENDIWSVGATFIKMVTGEVLNSTDGPIKGPLNISQYNLTYGGKSQEEMLASFPNDYSSVIKLIISKTLVQKPFRANAKDLLNLCNTIWKTLQTSATTEYSVFVYNGHCTVLDTSNEYE